ncbi:MAG: hypothetical protein CSA49_00025 [Gammaproteobacteria bacterium]|nr:MAG: hypothetical protein CSA49_00025 [Gammaproteobacteria bacterium]
MKKIVAVILSISALNANAIKNIESQRLTPIEEGMSGHVELKIDGKSGNSDEQDYGLSGRINHQQGKDLIFIIASKAYEKSNGRKDTDKSFIHGRWVHNLQEPMASEVFAQYQDNEFTRLLSRYLIGGGIRYTMIQDTDINLILGAGAFYMKEKEDLGSYQTSENYSRLSSYASYKHQLNKNVSIISTAYVQPRIGRMDDYNILLNGSLLTRLNEQLKLKLAVNVTYDSEPPRNLATTPVIDVKSTDTEYSVSFVYQF